MEGHAATCIGATFKWIEKVSESNVVTAYLRCDRCFAKFTPFSFYRKPLPKRR